MQGFVEMVLRRLRQEPGFSRNRHYLALSSPEGRRALRIHRHLRSIERDLESGWSARVEPAGERVRITLRGPRGLRTAYLSPAEFRFLCTSPLARAALGQGQ